MVNSESLKLARTFLGKEVQVTMDRPLGSKHPKHGFEYLVNYGYIENTVSPDGEELDAYYLGVNEPLEKAFGKVIAVIHRADNDDDKLVVVPKNASMSDEEIMRAVHFQEQYFKSTILRK
jgi:inorganic pyrophosphatase